MNEAKFTKGPWQFTPCGPADSEGMGICAMWGDYETEKENMDANAKLISVAPDMYEMLNHLIDHDCINDSSLHKEVEILLAKARGEA